MSCFGFEPGTLAVVKSSYMHNKNVWIRGSPGGRGTVLLDVGSLLVVLSGSTRHTSSRTGGSSYLVLCDGRVGWMESSFVWRV